MPEQPDQRRLAVFAPSPLLTVTIEQGSGAEPEVHIHAGDQGFWVARMAAALGAEVVLCCPLGGEAGAVLKERITNEGVIVRSVRSEGANAAYVHDRRDGQRVAVAETRSPRLLRHELDELYGVALTTGLDADITLLTGPHQAAVLPGDTYHRLAGDLRANGSKVIADLTGKALAGALEGGVDLLKMSDEEVVADGYATTDAQDQLVAALERLTAVGADNVLISRAREPALASVGGQFVEIVGPRFSALDPHGTGDSMFAAIGFALAGGPAWPTPCASPWRRGRSTRPVAASVPAIGRRSSASCTTWKPVRSRGRPNTAISRLNGLARQALPESKSTAGA